MQVFRYNTALLPNLSEPSTTLSIVLAGELLALVLALTQSTDSLYFWLHLGWNSLFIQLICLSSSLLIMYIQKWVIHLPLLLSIWIYFFIIQIITFSFSYLAGLANNDVNLELLLRQQIISAILSLSLLRYLYIQQLWKCQIQAEEQSRFIALQARIRPHFLFNSLNTIASLINTHPQKAEEVVLDLAELFRAALREDRQTTLSDELELLHQYLKIEQLRLGQRLKINWIIETQLPDQLHLPALILQPLVENAVYHGIQPLKDGGTLELFFKWDTIKQRLYIRITNPLPNGEPHQTHTGHRVAQTNVQQRLCLAYGEKARFTVQQNTYYCVSLELPTDKL